MTLSTQKLEIRMVAAQGALKHLGNVERDLKFMRAHINTTTGLASGKSTLERLEKLSASLRKNVSAELGRIEARLRKAAEATAADSAVEEAL